MSCRLGSVKCVRCQQRRSYRKLLCRSCFRTAEPAPRSDAKPPENVCRHCRERRVYARGLCKRCHGDADIRERYSFLYKRTPTTPVCRHCQKWHANRPRGLCWTCYYTPAISALYPSTSKFASKDDGGDFCGGHALPPAATDALPGTEGKILALQARVAARVALWHPGDAEREE